MPLQVFDSHQATMDGLDSASASYLLWKLKPYRLSSDNLQPIARDILSYLVGIEIEALLLSWEKDDMFCPYPYQGFSNHDSHWRDVPQP